MSEDKTGISEMVWLLRLRQGCLPLAELTCAAISAPWECRTSQGGVPSSPDVCASSKRGSTCTLGRERERRVTPVPVIRG